jgi:hypothetical protein
MILLVGSALGLVQSCSQRTAEDTRAKDNALQAYLDQMSTLLVPKGNSNEDESTEDTNKASAEGSGGASLKKTTKDDEKRTLARSRTLTILDRLSKNGFFDRDRRVDVVQFLSESYLITGQEPHEVQLDAAGAPLEQPIISLQRAHLEGINLSERNLEDVT